jgi:hypothetical protein
VLTDRLHDLPVPAVFPLHVYGDQRMCRGYQQQDVENQAENQAKHDQNRLKIAENGCPFSSSPNGGNRAART